MSKEKETAIGDMKDVRKCPECGGKVYVCDSRMSRHG